MIIPFSERRDVTAEDAWQTYVRLAAKAQETLRLEDGMAAGKAYAAFVRRFCKPEGPDLAS